MFVSKEANLRLSKRFLGRTAFLRFAAGSVTLRWNVKEGDEWWSAVQYSYHASGATHRVGLTTVEESPECMLSVLDYVWNIVEKELGLR